MITTEKPMPTADNGKKTTTMEDKNSGANNAPEQQHTNQESDIDEFANPDDILAETEEVIATASMTKEEVDTKIDERQKAIDELRALMEEKEENMQKLDEESEAINLSLTDYEQLVKEGLIRQEHADKFQKIDEAIAQLESLKEIDDTAAAQREKLLGMKKAINEKLEEKIIATQEENAARIEKAKNDIFKDYAVRVGILDNLIAEIEANPKVIAQLYETAKSEMDAQKKEIQEKQAERLREYERVMQSLDAKHQNAFANINKAFGGEDVDIADELSKAMDEKKPQKKWDTFNTVRRHLIKSIIEGEGEEQIKEPKEIIPWLMKATSVKYFDAINMIASAPVQKELEELAASDNERAARLLDKSKKIIRENEMFRMLIGKKKIIDKKTKKERLGDVWAAFEKRKDDDAFKEAAAEVLEKGGFVVDVPIYKKVKGKNVEAGKKKGAVLVEKTKSKKGSEVWKIVAVAGAAQEKVKVGQTAPLDMSSFPHWLKEGAQKANLENE